MRLFQLGVEEQQFSFIPFQQVLTFISINFILFEVFDFQQCLQHGFVFIKCQYIIVMSKFSKEEHQKFLRDLQDISLDSDSELQQSFCEMQRARIETQIKSIRKDKNNNLILDELKKNIQQQEDMITEYEKDMGELQQITKNETKNVIDEKIINQIKAKVAQHNNLSVLQLADQQYNLSVMKKSQLDKANLTNRSFYKKNTIAQQIQKEEETINKKIDTANNQREQLSMEQEDKMSMKYQMDFLSNLFSERFIRPKLKKLVQNDNKIQLASTKIKNTFTNLTPQIVNQANIMPKNSPEIALKELKSKKKKLLKPTSISEVKVVSKIQSKAKQQFEQITVNERLKLGNKQNLQQIFIQYMSYISKFIGEIERISQDYSPKFLKYLQDSQKNVNYQYNNAGQVSKQKMLCQVASLQRAQYFKQLKFTFESITNLTGIQKFVDIQAAQLQFNSISLITPIQKCTRLIQLNLSNNKLKDISAIQSLPWLRLLNIQRNGVRQLNANCKSLQVVYAGFNFIEDINVNQSKYLRILILNNNKLNELPKLKLYNLEELDLSRNQLKSMKNMKDLILLKRLNLSNNRIDEIVENIIYLYLNELNLSNNYFSKLNLLFLPCLERLYLNNNRLVGRCGKDFYLPNLKQLNVDQNRLEGFSLIWQMVLYSRNVQIIKYNNNQYFLNLREKIREIYEYIIYKYMPNIKIINESNLDIGIKKYLQQNYDIYYNNIEFFNSNSNIIKYIENSIKFILQQFNFGTKLQTNKNSFTRQKEYINYQSIHKINRLKHIIQFVNQYSTKKNNILSVNSSLFYHYDQFQLNKRNLFHRVRTMVVKYKYKRHLKAKYFIKNKVIIAKNIQYILQAYTVSQIRKNVRKFKMLLNKMTQNQAAIKIQKVWRGYIRRKIYKRIKALGKKHLQCHSDEEEVDTDFFNGELQKYEFNLDIEGVNFEDVIIRPQVFEMLNAKQKNEMNRVKKIDSKEGKQKEKDQIMMNNFLQSQKKFKQKKTQQELTPEEKMMKQWKITDPALLKTLQYKNQKRTQARNKELQKMLTASERFERFKKSHN